MESGKSNKKTKGLTDLAYLQNISEGNKEFMEEMINLFIDQSKDYIDSFREGVTKKDFELVARVAHKMKPVLGYVGMDPEKHQLVEIEQAARDQKDFGHIVGLINILEVSIGQANYELRDYLAAVN